MTNNVGLTQRQARPTYVNNSAVGAMMGGLGGLLGNQANMNRMLGGASPAAPSPNLQGLMSKAIQGGVGGIMGGGGTMRTQPVGPAIPVQAPTAQVNMRNTAMPAVTGAPAGTPASTIAKGAGRPQPGRFGMFGQGRFR